MRRAFPVGCRKRIASRYNSLLLCTKRRRAVSRRTPGRTRARGLPRVSRDVHDAPSAVRHVKQRPVYLDLLAIRLPLPGIVSILHRASRRAAVPRRDPAAAVRGLDASLASPEAYAAMKASFAHPVAKLVLIGAPVGVSASLLRRHPLPAARHPSRDRARARAPLERRRARAEPRADARSWRCGCGDAPQHVVGAHYGLHATGSSSASPRSSWSLYTLLLLGDRAVERRHRLRAVDATLFAHGGFKLATFLFMVALL